MSKISTYSLADEPLQLSDRLIGTEAPRPIPSATPLATKNFSLGELLQLFSSNFPAASLQAVLDTNNTATEDINLTGTINTTLIKPGNIIDMLNSQGTPLQILSKGVGGICWIDGPNLSGYVPTSRELTINGITYDLSANRSWTIGTGTQNLQEVTDEGNETTNPLIVINNNGFNEQKAYISSSFIEVSDKDIALNETTRVTLENSGIRRFNIVDGNYLLDLTDASNAVPITETRLLKAPILASDAIIATTDDIGTWGALDYPTWTTGIPFVKMTAVGTFALDTNTYLTSADLTGFVPYTGATQNVNLGEFELKAGQLTLDISPTGTAAVGTTRWNNSIGSSETTLKGGTVILKNGVDLVARVVNKVTPNTTLTKANYAAVRVSGAQGQRLAVAYAQANNDNNSADTIGLVTETIPTNQEGFIITVGQLEDINTTGSLQGETWTDGDVLYLSPTTPGSLTNIKPVAPGHIVVIGYVEYAHVNHGKIYVKIMNGWELDELHNVAISTPLNNQALVYETSTNLWKNKTIIQDSITNGVTEIAPSQNAVFDALALKQDTITLTTTGSGAATLVSNILNIPTSSGTVTSVAALTLGTSGTDLSSTVSDGTTTPVITLNVPNASATARGVINTGVQTIAGAKTFTSEMIVNNAIRIGLGNAGGTNLVVGNAFASGLNASSTGNIAIGSNALTSIGTTIAVSNNIAIGSLALNVGSQVTNNVAIGTGALRRIQFATNSNNVAVGFSSGELTNSGGLASAINQCTLIGSQTTTLNNSDVNSIVIGFQGRGNGSNTVTIGNTSIVDTFLRGRVNIPQYTTGTRPAYVKGAIIFDTTLNKLVVGGATAWEVITSS